MKKQHIPDFVLEQYILKELPEKRILEIDELLKQNINLQKRIKKIETSNAEILREYPEEVVTSEIKIKYNNEKSHNRSFFLKIFTDKSKTTRRFMFPSLVLAAVVAMAFLFILPGIKQSSNIITMNDMPDTQRSKGSSAIYLYRKSGNKVEILQNGSLARKGDLLQIAYISDKDVYGIILSIDSRGTVTLHYPLQNAAPAKLVTGKKMLLGNSYELDDAPDFERFFLITANSKLDVKRMLNAAEDLARDRKKVLNEKINLDGSINQISITIKKEK